MEKKLTITIPCYNQPHLLFRCLTSLREQTNRSFCIIIIDDQSNLDYKTTIEQFPDLDITYTRNEINKGAMGNMLNSITLPVSTPYIFSLHEDDVVHFDYIENALNILDANEDIVFVGSSMTWFTDDANLAIKKKEHQQKIVNGFSKINQSEFILKMLSGLHFCFGSIIYRSRDVKNTSFDLKRFSVLCDRPYLASLLQNRFAAIVNKPSMYVRDHGLDDHRGDSITCQQIYNLFLFYKQYITTTPEEKVFFNHSTNNILYSYHRLLRPELNFITYIHRAHYLKLIRYRCIKMQGLLGIIRGILK